MVVIALDTGSTGTQATEESANKEAQRSSDGSPSIPDLDGSVLAPCCEPLSFAVKCDCSDVALM